MSNENDLPAAVTAMLNEVHPGDDTWFDAYDLFFEEVKKKPIDDAIDAALDFLKVPDAKRLMARGKFRSIFGTTPPPKALSRFTSAAKTSKVSFRGVLVYGAAILLGYIAWLIINYLIVGVLINQLVDPHHTGFTAWGGLIGFVLFVIFMCIAISIAMGIRGKQLEKTT